MWTTAQSCNMRIAKQMRYTSLTAMHELTPATYEEPKVKC